MYPLSYSYSSENNFYILSVLGTEPRTLSKLDKQPATDLHLQPTKVFLTVKLLIDICFFFLHWSKLTSWHLVSFGNYFLKLGISLVFLVSSGFSLRGQSLIMVFDPAAQPPGHQFPLRSFSPLWEECAP